VNSRERLLAAINHKEPDRVPFDLGGTVVTSIHVKAYQALREYLGLPSLQPVFSDVIQQVVRVDDDVMERLGVDVRNVSYQARVTARSAVQDRGNYTCLYDELKVGWQMPKDGGWYYDMFDNPLAGPVTEADVEGFAWPDPLAPSRFTGLRDAAHRAIAEEQRAVVVGSISAGIMEVASRLRGFQDYFVDFAANPKLLGRIMDRVLEMQLAYWGRIFEILGDDVDVVQSADDIAGQHSLLISPRSYRAMVKPRHKELFDFIHAHSKAKIFFHSCGAIRPLIPDLIEIGLDILNPVQVSAAGMDTTALKREFGKDLTFWGGGVDTQQVLGSGTPHQVREEVRRRLEDLMPGGGFVFAAVHNIQGNVPPQNIMAMWETLQEFGTRCT